MTIQEDKKIVYDPNRLRISEIDVRTKHYYRSHNKGNQTFDEMIEFCDYVNRDPKMHDRIHYEQQIDNGLFELYLQKKERFGGMKHFWEFMSNPDWRTINFDKYNFIHYDVKEESTI